MQIFNNQDGYGAVAKALHWSAVIFVALAWLSGDLHDLFPRGQPRTMANFAHASIGLVIFGLLALRLMWRIVDRPPTLLPTALGQWSNQAARYTQYLLYALLAAIPIIGIVLLFARGEPVPLFGLYEIASPWTANRSFARAVKSVHELLANSLVIVAGLHAVAALAHHWIFQDRTLVRMLPGRIR